MSASPVAPGPVGDDPEVPGSLWAFAGCFVVAQLLELARRGPQPVESWPLSMLAGVVLVVLFSHGVVRVGWVRLVIVAILVGLGCVVSVVGLVVEPSAWGAVSLALALVEAATLRAYWRTEWFARQRRRDRGSRSVVPVLAVAALVGALGGVVGTPNDAIGSTVEIG